MAEDEDVYSLTRQAAVREVEHRRGFEHGKFTEEFFFVTFACAISRAVFKKPFVTQFFVMHLPRLLVVSFLPTAVIL